MSDGSAQVSPARDLRRRSRGRLLGGVAGGLADHFGAEPLLVRGGFVVLSLFAGAGLLLYALGWLLIPEEGSRTSLAVSLSRDLGLRKLTALIAVGAALLVLAGPVWMPLVQGGYLDASLVWAFLLVVLGVALLQGDDHRKGAGQPDPTSREVGPPAGSADAPGEAGGRPVQPAETDPARAVTAPLEVRAEETRRAPRRRSPLGWITLALALVTIGGGALLGNLRGLDLESEDLFALGLAVAGGGLAVGAFWGRARWLIPLGLLLLPIVLVMSVIEMPLQGAVGASTFAPRRPEALDDDYRVLAGDLYLYLRDLDIDSGEPLRVPVKMVAGSLTVAVPRGVAVELRGRLGAGFVNFFGADRSGVELALDETSAAPGATRRLALDVDAEVGSVNVYRDGLVKDLRKPPEPKNSPESPSNQGAG